MSASICCPVFLLAARSFMIHSPTVIGSVLTSILFEFVVVLLFVVFAVAVAIVDVTVVVVKLTTLLWGVATVVVTTPLLVLLVLLELEFVICSVVEVVGALVVATVAATAAGFGGFEPSIDVVILVELLLLLFTFELLLVVLVAVVRVQDFVQRGSTTSSLTISQLAALLDTVTDTILAVVVLTEHDELAEAAADVVEDVAVAVLPDFCCCSRCNRVVTPDVNESTIHCD